jgi:hypothetical protein
VVIANELADFLREKEYKINLEHRDIRKGMNGVEKYE